MPKFPDGFIWGAATAAHQVEGGNVSSDCWALEHAQPSFFREPSGEACDQYHRFGDDVAILAGLGLKAYRFSIEWARVEPQRDVVDEQALAHYDAFIDALVAAGIRPLITLHHFSNPLWVDDPRDVACVAGPTDANLCGWNHAEGGPEVAAEFAEHAALLAARFGDRVDEWATVNEPMNYLLGAYGQTTYPPGKDAILTGTATIFIPAVRNYIAGHALAYDALHAADTVDADGDGEPALVGFTQAVGDWVPARDNQPSDDPEDIAAVQRIEYVYHALFVDAVRDGGFDPQLDGSLDEPHPEWRGKLDWLGVQYYFRAGVTSQPVTSGPNLH